jgi:hypothetical protein
LERRYIEIHELPGLRKTGNKTAIIIVIKNNDEK